MVDKTNSINLLKEEKESDRTWIMYLLFRLKAKEAEAPPHKLNELQFRFTRMKIKTPPKITTRILPGAHHDFYPSSN